MQFSTPVTLQDIIDFTNAKVLGETNIPIRGINEIHKLREGDISFVDHPKYYQKMLESPATFILINEELPAPENKVLLIVDDPFTAYNGLVKKYSPRIFQETMIHHTADIDPSAIIQPGVFIGPNVKIGARTILHAGVHVISSVEIGTDCIIHSGTVLSSDAFYYHQESGEIKYEKWESCGRVIIEDFVEIGANCTLDKGVSGDTIIGRGTKIDNQVHIAHGVEIGKNCLIAAQVAIAGKVIIEDDVKLWGQVGLNKSLRIGKGAEIYAQSGVAGDLEGNKSYFGSPADEAKTKIKEQVWTKRVEELWKKVIKLEEK